MSDRLKTEGHAKKMSESDLARVLVKILTVLIDEVEGGPQAILRVLSWLIRRRYQLSKNLHSLDLTSKMLTDSWSELEQYESDFDETGGSYSA